VVGNTDDRKGGRVTMLEKLGKHPIDVLARLPVAKRYLRETYLRRHFRVELDLIRGEHRNTSEHPSIIHFSVNKAATQYVKGILSRCASEIGMTPVSIHDYAFGTDFPYLDHLSASEMQKYEHIFKPNGYLYSMFGGMIEGIPALDKFRVVLMVRDPRDVLTSSYYSIAYSHPEPDQRGNKYKHFIERRRNARNSTIDQYVLAQCESTFDVYRRYKTLLIDKYPKVYLTKYEDMTSDFRVWLQGLLDYCTLRISDDLFRCLLEENRRLRPQKEDIYKHIRKGEPGDYQQKLAYETIRHLNSRFSSVFDSFGYT
jgi:hypothetical protein